MVLDLDPEDVPHFFHDYDGIEGRHRQRAFLKERGLAMVELPFDGAFSLEDVLRCVKDNCRDVPLILSGESVGGCGHSVVVLNGEIFHDPTGTGIIGPHSEDNYYWLTFFSHKAS